jgi:hypothetical protein
MINLEQGEHLYDFLTEGEHYFSDLVFESDQLPNLSPKQARAIIYLLQEHFKVMKPYNQCRVCKRFYDGSGEESDSAMIFTDMYSSEDKYGFSQELLEKYDGYEFCSMRCLIDFLWEKEEDNDND